MSAHHRPGASIETGNSLGTTRSVVRQSQRFRQNESGNAMKSLLGQDNLAWDTENKQGVFAGQAAHPAGTGVAGGLAPAVAHAQCRYQKGDPALYTGANGVTDLVTVTMVSWEGVNIAAGEEPMISVQMPDGHIRDTVLKRLSVAPQPQPEPEPVGRRREASPPGGSSGVGGGQRAAPSAASHTRYTSPSWDAAEPRSQRRPGHGTRTEAPRRGVADTRAGQASYGHRDRGLPPRSRSDVYGMDAGGGGGLGPPRSSSHYYRNDSSRRSPAAHPGGGRRAGSDWETSSSAAYAPSGPSAAGGGAASYGMYDGQSRSGGRPVAAMAADRSRRDREVRRSRDAERSYSGRR